MKNFLCQIWKSKFQLFSISLLKVGKIIFPNFSVSQGGGGYFLVETKKMQEKILRPMEVVRGRSDTSLRSYGDFSKNGRFRIVAAIRKVYDRFLCLWHQSTQNFILYQTVPSPSQSVKSARPQSEKRVFRALKKSNIRVLRHLHFEYRLLTLKIVFYAPESIRKHEKRKIDFVKDFRKNLEFFHQSEVRV